MIDHMASAGHDGISKSRRFLFTCISALCLHSPGSQHLSVIVSIQGYKSLFIQNHAYSLAFHNLLYIAGKSFQYGNH